MVALEGGFFSDEPCSRRKAPDFSNVPNSIADHFPDSGAKRDRIGITEGLAVDCVWAS